VAGRIVGVGQPWAGDDGVGIAVVRSLREHGAPVDAVECDEPSRLIDWLSDGVSPVVIVDAVLDAGPPGRVLVLGARIGDFDHGRLLSSHGLGVMEAIELARIAEPLRVAQDISIVGITVRAAPHPVSGLSGAVAAAVAPAAATALRLAGGRALPSKRRSPARQR